MNGLTYTLITVMESSFGGESACSDDIEFILVVERHGCLRQDRVHYPVIFLRSQMQVSI